MRCTDGGGRVSGPGGLATRRGCLGDNQLTDAELEAELYAVAELYARLQH